MRRLIFALLLVPVLLCPADAYTFTDVKGRKLTGKILKVEGGIVTLELKPSANPISISIDTLCAEDKSYLNIAWGTPTTVKPADPAPSPEPTASEDDPKNSRLYPKTKEEIRAMIREIEKRRKPADISKEVHEATEQLNVFRYLCGVPFEVKPDAEFSKDAADAALACKKNGGLAHTLGHSTDKCNLASIGDVKASVPQYIEDGGENNRDVRGHREWCLHPTMGKVGFGSGGDSYSAMWCMDGSGKSIRGTWSYPGHGFFPIDYMHGNAWSLYGAGKPDSLEKLTVEVFRLSKRPDNALPLNGEIDGTKVKINHVSLGMGGINFEPEDPARRGIYWVRATGGGVRAGYLVELY